MSTWKCRHEGGEIEGLSFNDVADFIRAGKLGEDDLVCRSGSGHWQRARDVIGLIRAASLLSEKTQSSADGSHSRAVPPLAAAVAPCGQHASGGDRPDQRSPGAHDFKAPPSSSGSRSRTRTLAVAATITGLILALMAWQLSRPERFPPKISLARPRTYQFPMIGEVSRVGMLVLCGDIAVVAGIAGAMGFNIIIRRRRNE